MCCSRVRRFLCTHCAFFNLSAQWPTIIKLYSTDLNQGDHIFSQGCYYLNLFAKSLCVHKKDLKVVEPNKSEYFPINHIWLTLFTCMCKLKMEGKKYMSS